MDELINEEARRYFEEIIVPIAEVPAQKVLGSIEEKFNKQGEQFLEIQNSVRSFESETRLRLDEILDTISNQIDLEIQKCSLKIENQLRAFEMASQKEKAELLDTLEMMTAKTAQLIFNSNSQLDSIVKIRLKRVNWILGGALLLQTIGLLWLVWPQIH